METISVINSYSSDLVSFASGMLVQSAILILVLFVIDYAIKRRVRASFRYCLWMLALLKLVLPIGLSLPYSPANLLADYLPESEIVVTASVPQDAASLPVLTAPTHDEVIEEHAFVAPIISWQTYAVMTWLAGMLLMFTLLIQRSFFVFGLIRQAQAANDELQAMLTQCLSKMKMTRRIELRLSPNMASPSVCGLMKPMILLPYDLTASLNNAQIEAVLLHELAHIKRGDLWVNFIQSILQITYFFHPLLWFANGKIRQVREEAVDEMVMVQMDKKAELYLETLLKVSKLVWQEPVLRLSLIGVVESRSSLAARIKHIMSRPFPKTSKVGIIGMAALIASAVVLLPMAHDRPYKSIAEGSENDKSINAPAELETALAKLQTARESLQIIGERYRPAHPRYQEALLYYQETLRKVEAREELEILRERYGPEHHKYQEAVRKVKELEHPEAHGRTSSEYNIQAFTISLDGTRTSQEDIQLSLKYHHDTIWRKTIQASGKIELSITMDAEFDFPDYAKYFYLYFESDKFAGQWHILEKSGSKLIFKDRKTRIKLFRKRYVIIEYEFYQGDDINFKDREPMEKGVVAVSHWGSLPKFRYDWQIWQGDSDGSDLFGSELILSHHRPTKYNGFSEAISRKFTKLQVAPTDKYKNGDIPARKGKSYYCRVSGPTESDRGYGKIYIRDITYDLPEGIKVLDDTNS